MKSRISQQKETAKVFIKMGANVGIYNPRKSHRGIIAKRYMNRIEARELKEFEKKMYKFSFEPLKINDYKDRLSYI